MGSDDDPTDHAAVATSIFITVAIYAVRLARSVKLLELIISLRLFWSSADSKHIYTFERAGEGPSHCSSKW